MKRYLHIIYILGLLLMVGSVSNVTWAATVTYHILTLPIPDPATPGNYDYHMKSEVIGHRLEAFKVVVDGTTVELPAHYKSPLATGFTYYKPEDIDGHGGSAVALYDGVVRKGVLYDVKASPTPVAEGTAISGTSAEYYVVYTYNESNTIAKLDGSVYYNIGVKGKGFLSLNRGRNNRPAVVPTAKVDPEMLASPDFSYVDNPGNGISTYWADGNNKNSRDSTESKFFFGFKFEGKDPYHIVVKTSYARNYTYIEQNDDKKGDFVYKWYQESAIFAATTGNAYLASDDHIRYSQTWVDGDPNPQNPTRVTKTGFYHGNNSYWGTVALLNNTSNTGYVFMGTRTVNDNGVTPNSPYYLKFTNYNNLNYGQISAADATKSHTMDGIYPLKKVTFKIVTPFYAVEQTSDHIISVEDWVSQYTVDNNVIETKYLPSSLRRKYCNYTSKFYKDAACTQEITKFSDATVDPTEGYQVYIGYEVAANIPFKAITPAASYTASTWAYATWYELTDSASTQAEGLKLKYDGTNFKNNGADNDYDKDTEYAFIGDPYELRVVLRSVTSGATPYYVGVAGTPPATGTALTASTTASEGYIWELPYDASAGSFLLKKYKGSGNWYWDAGHPDPVAISYSTKAHTYNVATANAQTVTFNVSNLGYNEGDYILVTAGGTNASQVTVSSEKFYVASGGTASFTAAIKGRGDGDKQFTLSIQKYNSSDATAESPANPSVITVNQNNDAIVANTVEYNTTNSTRVKVMNLPKFNFTYNIVDKSGRIAVKATASQTIYSPLSIASIPSIIVSPYILDETLTFYSTYSGGGRGYLSSPITELTAGNALSSTNVYVKYSTSALDAKPIGLNEDQEFNVKLNGHYIYYDKDNDVIKTKDNPSDGELTSSSYLWKLRNRDPYAMLIDNLGAREDLSVTGTETVTVYDDNGGTTTPTRQKGAWVKLAAALDNNVALTFTTTRTGVGGAQQFVAKASLQAGVYEVMVADGGSVDASTTYYDIGCPEANTVKIYNNATYAHGKDELRFVLNQNVDYTYHLIDKAKHELLIANSKNPDLALPAEYQSPLVGTYNFYARDQITIDDTKTPYEYTPIDPETKITNISQLNAEYTIYDSSEGAYTGSLTATDENDMKSQANKLESTGDYYFKIGSSVPYTYKKVTVTRGYRGLNIYVTYDANDTVKFNSGQYMLKFLDPAIPEYYLEDGNDKLNTTTKQPVYPYCNGDGNLNVYDDEMQKEQFNGGASTRPRWVWYFISEKSDPYHVRIRSRSTISYKSVSHPTYLTTYVVHFNQDVSPSTKHVVTGGTLPGVASEQPTEYMVLGTLNNYKLLTTNEIDDGTTTERRKVTSLEQYWKTYNMVKLHVLGISKSTDEYSDDASTWVVPTDKRDDLETALDTKGVGTGKWHSYDAYANATRWNGYNDKSDGHEKKIVEKLEHWFQTFDMGTGVFDIEDAEVAPVLVLLDRHGWEIMRKPLPTTTYPDGDVELAALRVYDSPLVDKYYFYSNATKASGCHKYTLRMQNGAERDQIKVNGERYSSTSLGDLPPIGATGVKSGEAFNDQYVIYTVKEEYEKNYAYSLDEGTTPYTESGVSQPYLMLQNGRFYKAENTLASNKNPSYISKPIIEHTDPEGGNVYDMIVRPYNHGGTNNPISTGGDNHWIGNNFWYVKPNLNIDDEMGIPWMRATGESTEDDAKNKLRKEYKDKTGFDPYNIQLQLMNFNDGSPDGRYLTTQMTSAHLENGSMVGEYSLTAVDGDDVDTQAKKLRAIGKYYFKQKDAENYWLVNVSVAYNGSVNATYSKTPGSYADEWTNYKSTDIMMITLAAAGSATVTSEGYDHTDMQITNQTFMAVSDAKGNMQLMPRFDHTLRVDLQGVNPWATQLRTPVDNAQKASVDDDSSMGSQTTFFVRPQRFKYHIIDNYGREALIYLRPADFYPDITDHFKSPLAKNFTYYKALAVSNAPVASSISEWGPATGEFKRTLTKESMLADAVKLLPTAGDYYYRIGTRGAFTYKKVTVTKGLLEQEITGSFAAMDVDDVDEDVYVRYEYDEEADLDADRLLQGQWFTATLDDKDLQASGTVVVPEGATQGTGVNLYAGETSSRSLTAKDATEYESKRNALTETGEYYFKIGTTEPYTYKKVEVTSVPIDEASDYEETADDETFATLWSNSKPLVVDADAKKWQWKFLVAPTDPSSDYYVAPDPYAIQLFNRHSNYTTNPSLEPSPMAVGIKVPNANEGADRFALLGHPSGGYALVVAKTYSTYDYPFLNGASMTIPSTTAATTVNEASFTYKSGSITNGARVVVEDDVTHNFTYYVITNKKMVESVNVGNKLAITANQTSEEAKSHGFAPYLPESAQTPLLNMNDYKYYGFATESSGTYSVIEQTLLYTLSGLYDDDVYVRYNAYDMDKTPFKVPNMRNATGTGQVARNEKSVDVAMNIEGGLPYNIIWYGDNIMQSTDNSAISGGGSHDLSGDPPYVWFFTESDPYALKIKHKGGKYVDGTTTMVAEASAPTFMMLKKDGYDYGVMQVTGTTGANAGKKLTGFGGALTADASTNPTKYIIFGLSIHDLIYRLIINTTNVHTIIPYRAGDETTYTTSSILADKDTLMIKGTTQRDLISVNTGEGTHYAGEKYQLGTTLSWYDSSEERSIGHTYCYDAGSVSIGDELVLPNIFSRPNCTFDFYIEGIYQHYSTPNDNEGKPYADMNNKYKGLKLSRLMADDQLINQNVVVNVVYSFDKEVATNTGLGFVTSTDQNLWYTFETAVGETPYLAQYTNAWGLQSKEGRATCYTNDYLWTPLGDVYGFKMYNRYMIKNSGGVKNVMTMSDTIEGQKLLLAKPSTTEDPTDYPAGYEIFELVSGDVAGFFRVHPVVNQGATKFYVRRDPSDNYTKLSTTPCDWRFGLEMDLLEPYYERAGYVGGLTASGKTAYETAVASGKITNIQDVVYNDNNIVHYTPGYYRMHSQPGVSGIDPVRYASGYLHKVELTGDGEYTTGPIPMHFYSKMGEGARITFEGEENALGSDYTVTNATRGEITVDSTEVNPATIFYFSGTETLEGNPRSTIQTQGLYVAANPNGDTTGADDKKEGKGTNRQQRAIMSESSGITFSLMDIGGAVLLIHDGAAPATRRYLNYDQSNFFQRTATDDTDMGNQAKKFTSNGMYYFKIGSSTYKKLEVTTAYDGSTDADYSAAVSSTETEWKSAADKYDLKYYHDSPTDDAKWCLQPVQKTSSTLGDGELPLHIVVHNGGEGYYYSTFYAPFDVLLPSDAGGKTYNAYVCKDWNENGVHPVAVPAVTINAVNYAEGKFVPAATPVIIRTSDERDFLFLTLPTTSPSTPVPCVFTGSYLEQKLAADTPVRDVYTLGLPMISNVEKKGDYSTTGDINAPTPEFASSGVGFYINATYDKESDPLESLWKRNNLYVLHNKIYYRAPASAGIKSRKMAKRVDFVPLIFDDEEEEEIQDEEQGESQMHEYGDGVYDLSGRKVANEEQVQDGTWRQRLSPGIYIVQGKKIKI